MNRNGKGLIAVMGFKFICYRFVVELHLFRKSSRPPASGLPHVAAVAVDPRVTTAQMAFAHRYINNGLLTSLRMGLTRDGNMLKMLALLWFLKTAGAMKANTESELMEHLFDQSAYNKVARPIYSANSGISIFAFFGLNAIIKFDEGNQMLRTTVWMALEWIDPRLSWNSSVSSLEYLFLPADKVWRPWLHVMNSINGFERLGNDEDEVRVKHTGQVLWVITHLLETTCPMDISKYPFDTQACEILVGPALGSLSNTSIRCEECTVQLSSFTDNTEWDIKNNSITVYEYTDGLLKGVKLLRVKLVLGRLFLFYLSTLILPIACLSALTPTVFVLPADGGEKISLAVSVLLSYTVFLSGLNGSLPPNSDKICFFSVYLGCMVVISALSALLTANIINLHSRQGHVTWLWRRIICACCRRKSKNCPLAPQPRTDVKPEGDSVQAEQEAQTLEIDDVMTNTAPSGKQKGDGDDVADDVTWRDVAMWLDRMGMVLSTLLTLGCTSLFVLVVGFLPDYDPFV